MNNNDENYAGWFLGPLMLMFFGGGEMAVIGFWCTIATLICIWIYRAACDYKTGAYKEIRTSSQQVQYNREKAAITSKRYSQYLDHRLGKDKSTLWWNTPAGQAEWAELKALDEKYAVPGSNAYKEIREKQALMAQGKL